MLDSVGPQAAALNIKMSCSSRCCRGVIAMIPAKAKTTFLDLEPKICDADNMLDVLANMLDQAGLTSTRVVRAAFLGQ